MGATMKHPDIDQIQSKDPQIIFEESQDARREWSGTYGIVDPRISVLQYLDAEERPTSTFASYLANAGISVIGITGGYDILSVDALIFADQLMAAKVYGKWLHWEKQMHCFPLASSYGLPEGKEAFDWLTRSLRRLSANSRGMTPRY